MAKERIPRKLKKQCIKIFGQNIDHTGNYVNMKHRKIIKFVRSGLGYFDRYAITDLKKHAPKHI